MKAAVVEAVGRAPTLRDFPDPVPEPGELRIRVRRAALSNLVRSRASGAHYSSRGQLPFVVGIDGVGELEDGRRVYFLFPRSPYGSMSEQTVVPSGRIIALPDDLDDVTAAAIGNPGMSSWVALTERAHLRAGESVLINGATGTAGHLAVQIAKHLGARRVVATGRNADALRTASQLGADVTILLGAIDDAFEEAVQAQFRGEGVDVVLDYLWGSSAERIIAAAARAAPEAAPIRFVHVGALSGPTITLDSAALRASALEIMGSGLGSTPPDRIVHAIEALLRATVPARFKVETRSLPLSEIERAWSSAPTVPRVVFEIG